MHIKYFSKIATNGHPMTFSKYTVIVWLLIIFSSCQNQKEETLIKNQEKIIEVNNNLLQLKPEIGLVYYNGQPFSGTSVDFYANGKKKATIDFLQGKRQGFYRKWFNDGLLSFESQYVDGKQDGYTKSWWKNKNLRSEAFAKNGVPHGKQTQWYKSGAKFKVINLVNGKEQGLQKSWRENGKIYNNYEAKNGRIFGLKRAALCYELDDEIIQIKQN